MNMSYVTRFGGRKEGRVLIKSLNEVAKFKMSSYCLDMRNH